MDGTAGELGSDFPTVYLSPEENAEPFSLKAWHGANRYVEGLDEILKIAQDRFAIYSVRFQSTN